MYKLRDEVHEIEIELTQINQLCSVMEAKLGHVPAFRVQEVPQIHFTDSSNGHQKLTHAQNAGNSAAETLSKVEKQLQLLLDCIPVLVARLKVQIILFFILQ